MIRFTPSPSVLAYLQSNGYLEPYQYVSGIGWYAYRDSNTVIPVFVPVDDGYIVEYNRQRYNFLTDLQA